MSQGSSGSETSLEEQSTPESTGGRKSFARVFGTVLLVIALAVVAFTRLELARTKTHLDHDEAISVIAATGHDLTFETSRVAMSNQWVPVSQWQRYMRVEDPLDFAPIEPGLSQTDIAPPLYFWILHVWLWVFGSTAATPMLLNIPIAILTALALTGLMRRVTGSFALGAATALAWALTPQAWLLSGMARQYDLFALFSVLMVWQTLRFIADDANPTWDTVLLALVFAGGMLTHYYFALVAVAAGLVIVGAIVLRRAPRLAVRLAVGVALSLVLFVALNPGVLHAYSNMQNRLPSNRSSALAKQRMDHVINVAFPGGMQLLRSWASAARKVTPLFRWRTALEIAAVLGLVLFVLALRRGWLRRLSFGVVATVFFAVWTTGLTVALYVGFVSPPWAMDNRYMASVWVLAAAAIVALLSLLPPRAAGWAVSVWVGLMLIATVSPLSSAVNAPLLTLGDVSAVHHVIIDTNRRGYVTRYLLELPSGAQVYVGNGPDLAANPVPWLGELDQGDLFVHIPGASAEGTVSPTTLIEQRFALDPIPGSEVDRLVRKTY